MKSLFSALFASSILVPALVSTSVAAPPKPEPTVVFRADPAEFRKDSTTLRVRIAIPKGWHIQSDKPLDEFLIPTELKAAGAGLRFGTPVFPKPMLEDFPALGGKVALFQDTVEVRLGVRREAKGVKLPSKVLLGKSVVTLRYQACNDSQCLPPRDVVARFTP